MPYDYDWAIIGDSYEGRTAALHFVRQQNRVALVQQPQRKREAPLRDRLEGSENIFLQGMRQWLDVEGRSQFFRELGLSQGDRPSKPNYAALKAWVDAQHARRDEQISLPMLAIAGVDVVREAGEFARRPELRFVVPNRVLRARRYLIATGSHYPLPKPDNNKSQTYWTPRDLEQPEVIDRLPRALAVFGNSPTAAIWTQYLQRLGHRMTLAFSPPLLPQQDRDLAHLLRAQLESEGVQFRAIAQPISGVLEAGEIVTVMTPQPNLEGLNLEGVGVECLNGQLVTGDRLQTSNSRIYACGSVLGGLPSPAQIRQELRTLVPRRGVCSCFQSIFTRDSPAVPLYIPTLPPLTQVGLTEERARHEFGDRVTCMQFYPAVSWQPEELEMLKVIVLDDRRIVGVHFIGECTRGEFAALALAVNRKIPWQGLAQFPFLESRFNLCE